MVVWVETAPAHQRQRRALSGIVDAWKYGRSQAGLEFSRSSMAVGSLYSEVDQELFRRRLLVETVIGQLKSQMQLEHTRHRGFKNCEVNIYAALLAYQFSEVKPSLNVSELR